MIEKVMCGQTLLALILRAGKGELGIQFFTDPDESLQLGYMSRQVGYIISPHVHQEVPRQIEQTREVLFIRKGKVRADFYGSIGDYFRSEILYTGDVVLLSEGGHGFEMLEDSEIVEVKQGPYVGEQDKRIVE